MMTSVEAVTTGRFFELREVAPGRWQLPITDGLCGAQRNVPSLFGGVGIAAGLEAMELATGKACVSCSAHYVSRIRRGDRAELTVDVPAQGRMISQARATMRVGSQPAIVVSGALVDETPPLLPPFSARSPVAERPLNCPLAEHWRGGGMGVHSRFEIRLVAGRYGLAARDEDDGRRAHTIFWVRSSEGLGFDRQLIAVASDLAPASILASVGPHDGGASLDNVLRIASCDPSDEWLLAETSVVSFNGAIAHVTMNMFSESGRIVATANQTLRLRTLSDG